MASSSLKRYIDDLDSSTEDEDFEGIDTSDAGETEESDIESSSESTDSGDDDIGNARDWCEITASGRSGPPRFPFTGTPGVTFPVNINYTPLDILEMFLDSNLMDIIVKETNNYAEQERKANRAKISRCSSSKKWIPTNDKRNEALLWANNSSRCPKTKSGYVLVSSKNFAYSQCTQKSHAVEGQWVFGGVERRSETSSEKIGGEGKIVEFDESKFGKRNYNRSHAVEGQWVFGGVERRSETSSEKIGGEGKIVEFDESKFGKRNYNRSHAVEGQWVFGGVERRSETSSEKIGGEGKIVEVDESKFGKRNYNRSHAVEGQWVFGGVERRSGTVTDRRQFVNEVAQRRSVVKVRLWKLMNPNFEKETIIEAMQWRGSGYLEV
ncbi:piggyBac transposable element-derived protein 4 [Trichonephila clavata]|uniref:PiggyBac transposable element-derived protein 4 n=1 Tax=Trichonephila clavata TaxID=2740835 RepID=A0A8X6EYJ3_TRICU|nr:piggyBac transposable element-derived protein 4 [Trichonephila clavata]